MTPGTTGQESDTPYGATPKLAMLVTETCGGGGVTVIVKVAVVSCPLASSAETTTVFTPTGSAVPLGKFSVGVSAAPVASRAVAL